jgi:hypothetical protein
VKVSQGEEYAINFEPKDGFNPAEWRLYDRLLDENFELSKSGGYKFNALNDIPDRFYLVKGNPVIKSEALSSSLYPNPADDKVTFHVPKPGPVEISIASTLGTVLTTRQVAVNESLEIDVRNLKSGLYFITIKTKDLVSTHKLIKK